MNEISLKKHSTGRFLFIGTKLVYLRPQKTMFYGRFYRESCVVLTLFIKA